MNALPRVQLALLELLRDRGRTHAYEMKRILAGRVPHASVYAALAALQHKGYVSAEWAIPGGGSEGSEGGGPPRKYFELTAEGQRALAEAGAAPRGTRVTPAASEQSI